MECLIAYLLLALAFDLIRELFDPQGENREVAASQRRLWSDTHFDCRSRVFSVHTPASRRNCRLAER